MNAYDEKSDAYMEWPGLRGRRAIVTGAAGGQGLATARLLADVGVHVLAIDVAAGVEEKAAQLAGGAVGLVADITRPETWANAVELVTRLWDGVDILINNAGIYRRGRVEEMSLGDIDLLYKVNQLAPLLGVRAVVPLMRAQKGGSIVNVSSTAGFTGDADIVAYSMTKWASRGLTRSLANELAQDGIRVNGIVPGLIATAMADANGDETNAAILSRTFLKRMGAPTEVAAASVFLCSDLASYITGAELIVDGGLTV